jgi:hypothetical protein
MSRNIHLAAACLCGLTLVGSIMQSDPIAATISVIGISLNLWAAEDRGGRA